MVQDQIDKVMASATTLIFIDEEPTERQENVLEEAVKVIGARILSRIYYTYDKEIPSELEFILLEASIARYNRIGSEGMKSESVEGHSATYYDDLEPYDAVFTRWLDRNNLGHSRRGKVWFL